MAYDRFDNRDERSRWSGERDFDRDRDFRADRGRRDERGFFERAGDEISSWFGDNDAESRRRQDHMRDEREGRGRQFGREREHDHDRHDRDWNDNRGAFARGGSSDRDYNPGWQRELGSRGGGDFQERGRDYRPMTGDYGRSREGAQFFGGGSAMSREREERDRFERNRSDSEWGRDPYRSTSRAGTSDRSDRSRHERDFDPHYSSWRDRHMSELDRDYDDYAREHQSRFESDFGSWRQRRQQKRGLLGNIREHMEVVGNDDQHVGKIDKCSGDRIILAKSDPESGGVHHSLSCSDVDRIEGDRVVLDCSADQARKRWRDESRSRALFERDDQGEMGPRMLDRSFEGTYR